MEAPSGFVISVAAPFRAELPGSATPSPGKRKPGIRAIFFAARLIFTWDRLPVDFSDRAVAYLRDSGSR